MKQFYLLIFSFSLLTASEKSTSFTRFSDLTSDQKKRVNERLKRFEDRKELKKFDAVLRMSRFSTKRKGNDKKRLSKKLCRKKVSW